MLETNIRIVEGGATLRLPVRYATVEAAHMSSKTREIACNVVRDRLHVPAKPVPGEANEIVVLVPEPVRTLKLERENLTLTITDSERAGSELLLDGSGVGLIPSLLERALLGQVARSTNLWRMGSHRKWFERNPFLSQEGIEAFRRMELATLFVQGVGVGVVADVSTAFFTSHTLDYFFARGLSAGETKDRQAWFQRLSSRQKGQKGTLAYKVGSTATVCYFEKADSDRPCGKTPEFKLNGKSYPSVYHYYTERHPEAKITPDDLAILVSFRGIDNPVWVAARLLRARVMNESVPDSMTSIDKIAPEERVRMIDQFWAVLENEPFGRVPLRLSDGYWRPTAERVISVPIPTLEFADGQTLQPPLKGDAWEYKKHYRQRGEMLEKTGVYHLPPAADRTLHCAHPKSVSAQVAAQFAGDVARAISKWTGVPFKINLCGYGSLTEATTRLRTSAAVGTVLFILDDKPTTYYECAFQLSGWRVKRATIASVERHYKYLVDGAWDRRKRCMDQRRGWQKWEQYVQKNSLDILQQMDGIPFRVPTLGEFEGQIAIDVGHDRRYVAISLLIAREKAKNPNFRIITDVQPKTDPKLDTVNPVILADSILQLFAKVFRGKFDPLSSLVAIRDGDLRGQEDTGLAQAYLKLKEKSFLTLDASTSIAELHKSSQKNIRLWERSSDGSISNPLEGSAVAISSRMAVIATTGAATLHQGTADPLMVVSDGPGESLRKIVESVGIGAHLNWASPSVAQRLPLVFKRTDEELEIRSMQEIRRIA